MEVMDVRKIVVVVEDAEEARTALQWALHNLLRCGDLITLLHVYPSPATSRSRKKLRLLRLKGYQLALSFRDICSTFTNANIEIIVTEGDQEGGKIASMVREIGASTLVVGLHERSFLYKLAMAHNDIASNFNCRVMAIKQPPPDSTSRSTSPLRKNRSDNFNVIAANGSPYMDFSQIELAALQVPDITPAKIPYRICPSPSAIIWRSRKSRRKGAS
ncbi:uncharacterized protein LOC116215695 [Punica granatum]|uniref:Uncharacterized protein LOC116215695 n=1 Tax=Punica granatum TaxID=22663 RepID=A0A218VXM6_PUNGR|nr:uncharacterized protein LOC116215695 [Punica granatum]OWM65166.1 hypothetical protein CDL15_Pgr008753 [Punica granatum]